MRLSSLFGAIALSALAAPAMAADLGIAEPLPTPDVVAAEPANDWTGFYLGGLVGYNWAEADTDGPAGIIEDDGFEGGGYIGAAYQWGNFVLGVEGDVLASDVTGEEGAYGFEQGLNGSLRGRAGIALDRFMLYATAGGAATELELSGPTGTDEEVLWGWTAGAGAEAMLTDNVTARVEYRYADYEDEVFTVSPGGVESDLSTHSVRAGVGVKF